MPTNPQFEADASDTPQRRMHRARRAAQQERWASMVLRAIATLLLALNPIVGLSGELLTNVSGKNCVHGLHPQPPGTEQFSLTVK